MAARQERQAGSGLRAPPRSPSGPLPCKRPASRVPCHSPCRGSYSEMSRSPPRPCARRCSAGWRGACSCWRRGQGREHGSRRSGRINSAETSPFSGVATNFSSLGSIECFPLSVMVRFLLLWSRCRCRPETEASRDRIVQTRAPHRHPDWLPSSGSRHSSAPKPATSARLRASSSAGARPESS